MSYYFCSSIVFIVKLESIPNDKICIVALKNAAGEGMFALNNSVFIARHGLLFGENLPNLVEKITYYLEVSVVRVVSM